MKILVADDHLLVREGLKPFLAQLERKVQMVEAWDAATVRAAVDAHPDLDLALVDLNMPGMHGPASIAALRDAAPSLPVIVLSAQERPADIEAVLRAGASGFIPKSSSAEVMVTAIRLVLAGGQYLPPLLLAPEEAPAPEISAASPPFEGPRSLSPRQREVVGLLAQGLSNKSIARRLGLVEGTVKSHLAQIFHVLGVRNRTAAVMAAQALKAPADAPRARD